MHQIYNPDAVTFIITTPAATAKTEAKRSVVEDIFRGEIHIGQQIAGWLHSIFIIVCVCESVRFI